ncbi:LOW QUALITY PROTEIN: post-GPI attachment to proteins factor 4-like [Geothlypis trichas]
MFHRAWQLCCKWCHWSSPFIHLLTLTVVAFRMLAPLVCHWLLHSYFYLWRWHLNPMSQEFLEQNQEGQDALHYSEKMQMPNASKASGSGAFQPLLLITIITVQRQNDFHYVLQVASHFHRLLQKCGVHCQSHRMLLCNVEWPQLLSSLFSMVSHDRTGENPDPGLNQFEKENRGPGMFLGPVLSCVYCRATRQAGPGWCLVAFFALYSMALSELLGRHYGLELRRLHPALYNVAPASECCMPAMLFPAASARRASGYLQGLRCRKDTAIYSLLRGKGENAFLVEPILVRRMGMYSSLRLNSNPKLLRAAPALLHNDTQRTSHGAEGQCAN